MIVHDEDTLNEALTLVEVGPVRYSDQYAYIVITSASTLEKAARAALERSDVAVVVAVGSENSAEAHAMALSRVKAQRKKDEPRLIREFMREHPQAVEKWRKHFAKTKQLGK